MLNIRIHFVGSGSSDVLLNDRKPFTDLREKYERLFGMYISEVEILSYTPG